MILKKGMTGPEVANWQHFLKSTGIAIDVDGDFGNETHALTSTWQEINGLISDGIVGPASYAKASELGFKINRIDHVAPEEVDDIDWSHLHGLSMLEIMLSQYGVKEIPGSKHNPVILAYSKFIGYGGIVDDETSWCSIVANWAAKLAGVEQSGKLNARSWLEVGEEVTNPKAGDMVVFWRDYPESWKGHIAVFIKYDEKEKVIYCLGGNQSNMMKISRYPVKQRLSYRRLNKV